MAGGKLQAPRHRVDRHRRVGQLLLEAHGAPESLERLLAVTKLMLSLLTDVMRPGIEAQDTPVAILSQHSVTTRELGGHPDGSVDETYIQETCSFEASQGPKPLRMQGQAMATCSMSMSPQATAKSKRLGREAYVKVALKGTASVELCVHGEVYESVLPSLMLPDPLSDRCVPDWKGELLVVCRATGLSSSLVFKGSGGLVSGSLEQMMGGSSYSHLGTLEGCWRSRVVVRCPKLGMEGVIHEEGPDLRPALSDTISLANLGPQQMPRLWSALHDALLYNDPNKASGGKVGRLLSRQLSHQLGNLELPGVSSRDTVLPGGAGKGSDANATTGGQGDSDEDSDEDGGKDAALLGKRQGQEPDVMPCYKDQHDAGRTLHYGLRYNVMRLPGTLLL